MISGSITVYARPDGDGVNDRDDAHNYMFRSRWMFLGRAVRFDSNVQLPSTTHRSQAVDEHLHRLRGATELVACMLRVGVAAWLSLTKAAKPAFHHFQVSSDDSSDIELLVKVTSPRTRRCKVDEATPASETEFE